MTLFQVVCILFGLWMVYELTIYAKKRILSSVEVGLWIGLWIVFIALATFPELADGLVHQLHFNRLFDLLTVAALMILTVLIFFSYFAQKEGTQKLEKLVQEMAIKDGIKQVKKKKPRVK